MKESIFEEIHLIRPTSWEDFRGEIWTSYKKETFPLKIEFNHDKFTTSRKDTLRGIHGDFKSWKLISCVYGEIYLVIVDNRPESKNYLKWDWEILSDKNKLQVLIPPGFGNAHLVLSDHCVFHYKWSYPGEYPDVDQQFTLKWNDDRLGISWPIKHPILSRRDQVND